jgi:hypothetical protein
MNWRKLLIAFVVVATSWTLSLLLVSGMIALYKIVPNTAGGWLHHILVAGREAQEGFGSLWLNYTLLHLPGWGFMAGASGVLLLLARFVKRWIIRGKLLMNYWPD